MSSSSLKFKVLIVGSGNVGKTTLINRHRTGSFTSQRIPTIGADVMPLPFYTSAGLVTLNMWDCAGSPEHGGLRDGYYIAADAAIIMFDVCNVQSFLEVPDLYRTIRRLRPNIPIVLCGNKVDRSDVSVTGDHIEIFSELFGLQYYGVSAKSNYNFEVPFLYLMRKLVR